MADRAGVVIVGGGGHASVLLDALRLASAHHIVGYVALEEGLLSAMDLPWLGSDVVRSALVSRGITQAALGVAGAESNQLRRALFENWTAAGFSFVSIVHPRATIGSRVVYGAGLQVFAGAVINSGAQLGSNVVINTNATVEHHCQIGDHAHVAPGAVLCGAVAIGEGALIGAGAVAAPGIRVGRDALVGAGSTVIRDVADSGRVAGSPAKPLGSKGTHS
jgi:sugar O-acyltransferase (sialic acid O-acetyltransferase NeuD family)